MESEENSQRKAWEYQSPSMCSMVPIHSSWIEVVRVKSTSGGGEIGANLPGLSRLVKNRESCSADPIDDAVRLRNSMLAYYLKGAQFAVQPSQWPLRLHCRWPRHHIVQLGADEAVSSVSVSLSYPTRDPVK